MLDPTRPRIGRRDFDYIESRLLAPAPDLLDAVAKMRHLGLDHDANVVMAALKELAFVCRNVRMTLPVNADVAQPR